MIINQNIGVEIVMLEYYMEYDYGGDKDDSLYTSTSYKLLKNIPQNKDIVPSFFCIDKIEWQDESSTYNNELKFIVIPFPEDHNFDSSRDVNAYIKSQSNR